MNRIVVIGSAGSGKSTLSRKLSERLSLPVIHLDRFYWKPNWTPTPNEEWDAFLKDAVSQNKWIIDGNYSRTLDMRLNEGDAVIFLDMPRLLCIYRIIKRRLIYHGKTRPDLNEDCPEKLDWAFFVWVWNYKKRSRPKVIQALEQVKERKRVVILKTRKEVQRFLDQVNENGRF
ncbi:DNA topology modulation protein [Shouchella clausii]|uniref:AAA family ATPase n=1 Tax=Shouchella clausii TaxID=79880 RepID=A0A268S7E8_SHOCL|nr:DNA topology modulation protein [Shouchella clausii]PAD42101.1 AAA family ATPase [Bacillus sp. 7520-S]MBU8598164.1 DNA topology modulation protein [Shouchella clausii]MCR1286724.1 DNA topology modulation protein [Shouchella clausii]MCY1105930.1 DNA topology modulation protein [Shouchella clausii]MED4160928.1 DNA topology modulation protein [Shouchella clausii]